MSDSQLREDELEEKLEALLCISPSRSTARLASLLAPLARRQQERVLHWADVATRNYGELGDLIVSLAPKALERLDDSGFDAWALSGLDAYDNEGLRAAIVRMRDLDGFIAVREGRLFARFAEVELRLARFVQGLSGRPLALKIDAYPWTDTETIFLPERIAHFESTEDNRRLFKSLAVQLWAQTRYGTFNLDIEAVLVRWPEREKALAWLAHLEAVRLEACVARDLPGLGASLAELRGVWPEQIG